MKEFYIYKLVRSDGLSYVGSTCNFKRRMQAHKRSNRFTIGISEIIILEKCGIADVDKLEKFYVDKFDTYKNGLNMTPTGRGKSENAKFSTYGLSHSSSTRKKMKRAWMKRKQTGFINNNGRTLSTETKKKMSATRKGICWKKNLKINNTERNKIITNYVDGVIKFDLEFIKSMVKSSQKDIINSLSFGEMISPNGKKLTYETLYAHYVSRLYGVTPQYIKALLKGDVGGATHFTER